MMELSRTFADFPSAYATFDDVPQNIRLCQYEDEYAGIDVWGDYYNDRYFQDISNAHKSNIKSAEKRWKNVSRKNGCHHALIHPSVVDRWWNMLLDDMTALSAKKAYIRPVNRFYRYLMWHADYPHSYNPIQFAIQEFDLSGLDWSLDYLGDSDE